MLVDVKVPSPGESITEVQIANWLVEDGDHVEKDDEIVEIDSDKATLSINAENEGAINIEVQEGETVEVGAVIAKIDTEATGKKKEDAAEKTEEQEGEKAEPAEATEHPPAAEPRKETDKKQEDKAATQKEEAQEQKEKIEWHVSPLAKKLIEENNISQEDFVEFFKKYRISRADVEFYQKNKDKGAGKGVTPSSQSQDVIGGDWTGERNTEQKKMSTLRKKLSQRLVSVKNETAMLTTFN